MFGSRYTDTRLALPWSAFGVSYLLPLVLLWIVYRTALCQFWGSRWCGLTFIFEISGNLRIKCGACYLAGLTGAGEKRDFEKLARQHRLAQVDFGVYTP